MIKRHAQIIDLVNEHKKIDVNTLSGKLGVSPVTIRKDLDILDEKGLLTREHGYAVTRDTADINNRLAVRYETKSRIAREAAEMVSNGETVMIESGSSCALLAAELAKSNKEITIITNSAFIAAYIRDQGKIKVVLLGGEYQKESQVMIGPLVRTCAREFHVDKLFLGTDGMEPSYGFTGSDLMRTEATKSMAESAKKVIVLTDSSKFSRQGVVMHFRFEEVYAVVTDEEIPAGSRTLLEERGVRVYTVS